MKAWPDVAVLRLGHRPARDERMTTHVGLTARALGASTLLIAGDGGGEGPKASIDDVTDRFGGSFDVSVVENARERLKAWAGPVVHLTMYGLPIQEVEADIRAAARSTPEATLVVVGAEKVPFDVYQLADWNVGVTNQPHSEVASLAIFLDRLFEGEELERSFPNASVSVVARPAGKRLVATEEGEDAS